MADNVSETEATRLPCADDGSFEVQLNSSKAVYQIPAGESVLHVLENNGVYVPFACAEGICGTCVTGVLAGEPEHNDMFMSKAEHAENDQFTPCCSRSKTARLLIDL